MVPHFLDENVEKSMDCSPKVFWRSKALSVNPNGIIKKTSQFFKKICECFMKERRKKVFVALFHVLLLVYVNSASVENPSSLYRV